jgi:hypothetical protein
VGPVTQRRRLGKRAQAAGRTRSSALGQTHTAAWEWAEQAAAGPGSAGPRGRAQEGGLVGHARAGLRGGVLGREGGRSGPRCWWAEGGFPLFLLFLSLPFYSSSNLNIGFESKIQIFNEFELMPKHNNSTQKYASTCYATIKDPLRVLFYEDYAGIKK